MKDHRHSTVLATKYSTAAPGTDPNAGGMLTGKYHGHGSPEQGRVNSEMMKHFMPEQQRTGRIVAAVKAVSEQTGHGMAQVALAWLRYRPVPVIPILGARKLSPLKWLLTQGKQD